MKTSLMAAVSVSALIFIFVVGKAQTPVFELTHFAAARPSFEHSANLTVAQTEVPDAGSLTGSTYTNQYFGLRLTIPTNWQVQGSHFKKMVHDKGRGIIAGGDQSQKAELERATNSVLNFLTVTQYAPGTPGVFNSTFICGAEKISAALKTDADYMTVLKNTMRSAHVPHTLEEDIHTEQIGGVPFAVVQYQSIHSGVIANAKYCAHIVKGYALFFILVFQRDDQLRVENEILASVVLR